MFDAKLLRKATPQTLLFIQKAEMENSKIIFTDDNGKKKGVTADFKHEHLTKWLSGKYRVFIWTERSHDKKIDEVTGKITYFNHYLHRFFLIPGQGDPKPKPSTSQFDFGFHRIKDSLEACKAIHYLTITEEDIEGSTK